MELHGSRFMSILEPVASWVKRCLFFDKWRIMATKGVYTEAYKGKVQNSVKFFGSGP